MNDVFENAILCNKCNKAMKKVMVHKNGFNLRAVKCDKCNELVFHPADKQEYENFMNLKKKDFEVKMRMVGNSYAISIPRQIVDFMREQEKMINDMVRLNFEEAGRLSLCFNTPEMNEVNKNSRIVSAKEVRIVKNGKPVLHARKFYDSANPEKSGTRIFKAEKNKVDEDLEEEN